MLSSTLSGAYEEQPTTSKFSLLPHDVFRAHILPRLDGCSLASVGCVTPELYTLTSHDQDLWTHLCNSTWPSTRTPRMRQLIASSAGGARKFFSQSFPPLPATLNPHPPSAPLPQELISAVDIFYRGKCVFSKVQENETVTGWFRCSPFRVDLLDPKESVPTPIRRPSHDDMCKDLYNDLELSWIVVQPTRDPMHGIAHGVNVSSLRPVSVERHWLSGEVHVRFAAVVGHVMFRVDVTCVGCGPGGLVLHVVEACLQMEDSDGVNLNGRDSLVILRRVLEGKRGNCGKEMSGRVVEGRKRYFEYLERKKECKEKKLRREGRLDIMCVVFGVCFFASLFCWSFVLAALLKVMSLPIFRADQLRTRIRFIPS